MCELASESSPWLMVDPWEAIRKEYTRTALVLDHFADEINEKRSGIATLSGSRKPARIALLAGADLIGTMSTPGVWSASDLDHILGRYGAFIVERMGTDVAAALSFPAVNKWKENIFVIPQLIMNDVSSTKIRQFLGKEMKVDYLIDPKVIQYINHYGLYEDAEERRAQTHQRTKSGEARAVVNGEEGLKPPGQS
jgi:nicotinamide mononucleotide adenylyltransferase